LPDIRCDTVGNSRPKSIT